MEESSAYIVAKDLGLIPGTDRYIMAEMTILNGGSLAVFPSYPQWHLPSSLERFWSHF